MGRRLAAAGRNRRSLIGIRSEVVEHPGQVRRRIGSARVQEISTTNNH